MVTPRNDHSQRQCERFGLDTNSACGCDLNEEDIVDLSENGANRLGFDLNVGNVESLVGLNENEKNTFDIRIERETDTPISGSCRMSPRLGLKSDLVNEDGLNEGKEESLAGLNENGINVFHFGSTESASETPIAGSSSIMGKRLGLLSGSVTELGLNEGKKSWDESGPKLFDFFAERESDGGVEDNIGKNCDGKEKRKGEDIEEGDGSNSWGRRQRRREEKGEVVDDGGSSSRGVKRYISEEKVKARLDGDDGSVDRSMEIKSKVMDVVAKFAEVRTSNHVNRSRPSESRMERFRKTARENASRFAHFNVQKEEPSVAKSPEQMENVKDKPSPYSIGMKIVKDRYASSSWIPKNNKGIVRSKNLLPSLRELCMRILAKHVNCISSLEFVPEILRHRLCQLLCNSRSMNLDFFNLLVSSSPTEIRIEDCSWLAEEDFANCFSCCNTENLVVLQLDQCGRCLPDYIISSCLAHSPNSLPFLTTLSLSGGCRISDVALTSIVSSAPALKSLNISSCSLLTSDSIGFLANSLGSVLQELYIDGCQNINPIAILPALKRLQQLKILSVARILEVSDSFVEEFLVARGHNMKELILSSCVRLTDSSVKVIAKTCPGLFALDLAKLTKLTDSALGYLANGCRKIQRLKLCCNSFSDEAVAAFLESSGEHLTELSLNNVTKVEHNTALSIAKCAERLEILDVSWCRKLTDEALGMIVDSCMSLKLLKVFGCGQITKVLEEGHSNPEVQIIGMKLKELLDVQPPHHLLPS